MSFAQWECGTVVNRVPEDREILFVPDQNLGQWVMGQTNRKMNLWPGSYRSCSLHPGIRGTLSTRIPQRTRCRSSRMHGSVRDLADEVCSTEKMVSFCRDNPSETFIILTETGMMHRLNRELPDKSFVAGPTGHCACNDCRFMKMNTLPKLLECLRTGNPAIEMIEDLIRKAKLPSAHACGVNLEKIFSVFF